MPEYQEPEPQSLDLKPFLDVTVEDLANETITKRVPIETLGVMVKFQLEKVGFEEIPFISGQELRHRSWRVIAKIEKGPPLPETALKRIRILVKIYPEDKTFVGKIKNINEKVFTEWQETDESGKPLENAKIQPLLLDDNLIKIRQLEAGGFIQQAGRLTHG